MGEDVRQGDAADEEARGEEVTEIDGAGRVVGAKVVGAGAAPAEPVGQRRKREQEGCRVQGGSKGSALSGVSAGLREGGRD